MATDFMKMCKPALLDEDVSTTGLKLSWVLSKVYENDKEFKELLGNKMIEKVCF